MISALGGALFSVAAVRAAEPSPGAAILQDLRSFRQMATVLHVGAHPDDENTQLITYLARGRGYRAAYLSITRGDGGQNLLGSQLDEKLGVARTQELLAARRLDGGRQFFTRAIDFGYSKTPEETLAIWDRSQVLGDVVRIIRSFRPDVIVTRFPIPPGSGGHGHHIASAILAVEAFKLAGDPKAFPEQLRELTPWQPKRVLWNGSGFSRGGGLETSRPSVQVDIGGNDPVTGESFGAIASRSRAMHKTQGFGGGSGGSGGGGSNPQTFFLLGGDPATNDIMDGIDTTWARVPGGADIGRLADEAIAQFKADDPAASVPALLALRAKLAALATNDPIVAEKRAQLDRIVQASLGLSVQTVVPGAEVVPGESVQLHHAATVKSGSIPVRWLAVRYPQFQRDIAGAIELRANQPATRDVTQTLPVGTPVTQPYWLREDAAAGIFRVDDPTLIGRPENPPAFAVEHIFEVGGQRLVVTDEPVEVTSNAKGATRRRLDVIPPVSLSFAADVSLFAPGTSRAVVVEIVAARPGATGTVQVDAPAGWKVTPATQSFQLGDVGARANYAFTVTAPASPASARITAAVVVKGVRFNNSRIEVNYAHIPLQLLQPPARAKVVSLNLQIRGRSVGYLPGAGDDVPASLEQMGYKVTTLTGADLTPEKLRPFDAIVIGVRAYNTRTDLVPHLRALFAYAEQGGTVVAQYNRPGRDLKTTQLAPYSLTLSDSRVTNEQAPVTFLAPDHPALNTPNKITSADFDGWVQERGVYFPSQWDGHFTPILACGDPGEAQLKSGLLIAPYGKGWFVYTGLAFFRQLPAGVPGAERLFANLVSLGK